MSRPSWRVRAYLATGRVVLEIVDDRDLAAGRFVLDATPDGASCRATTEAADVTMSVRTLGVAVLAGVRPATLHRAGWLDEHTAVAVATADALLAWNLAPWCNTWF